METDARKAGLLRMPEVPRVCLLACPGAHRDRGEPLPPPILSISDCRTMGVHNGVMVSPALDGLAWSHESMVVDRRPGLGKPRGLRHTMFPTGRPVSRRPFIVARPG